MATKKCKIKEMDFSEWPESVEIYLCRLGILSRLCMTFATFSDQDRALCPVTALIGVTVRDSEMGFVEESNSLTIELWCTEPIYGKENERSEGPE